MSIFIGRQKYGQTFLIVDFYGVDFSILRHFYMIHYGIYTEKIVSRSRRLCSDQIFIQPNSH